jgi:hypothetical protein
VRYHALAAQFCYINPDLHGLICLPIEKPRRQIWVFPEVHIPSFLVQSLFRPLPANPGGSFEKDSSFLLECSAVIPFCFWTASRL